MCVGGNVIAIASGNHHKRQPQSQEASNARIASIRLTMRQTHSQSHSHLQAATQASIAAQAPIASGSCKKKQSQEAIASGNCKRKFQLQAATIASDNYKKQEAASAIASGKRKSQTATIAELTTMAKSSFEEHHCQYWCVIPVQGRAFESFQKSK